MPVEGQGRVAEQQYVVRLDAARPLRVGGCRHSGRYRVAGLRHLAVDDVLPLDDGQIAVTADLVLHIDEH